MLFLKTLTYINTSVKWSLEAGSKIESVPKKLMFKCSTLDQN